MLSILANFDLTKPALQSANSKKQVESELKTFEAWLHNQSPIKT